MIPANRTMTIIRKLIVFYEIVVSSVTEPLRIM